MRSSVAFLRFLLLFLLACFLTPRGSCQSAAPTSPDSITERSLPSMALVLTGDAAGRPAPAACAFIRRPDGVLLTAYHAVKNARQVQVKLTNGEVYDKVEVIAVDERRDAAALRIPAARLPVLPAGASEELKAGDVVYAVYSSAGTAWVIVPGLFRAIRKSDEVPGAGPGYRLLEFSPQVAPRLSGGVLLDVQGHALGLLVTFPSGTNVGYAVPLESVAGLADATGGTVLGAAVETVPPTPQTAVVPPKPLEPAGESKAAPSEKLSNSKTSTLADVLQAFKSYSVKSDTIYMHRETLMKELQKRPEFSAWGLTAIEDPKAADVLIVVTLPFLTWEWNYRMVFQSTGAVLGTGKVSAAIESTAAPQLAVMIVERIRTARPVPASFWNVPGTQQALASSGSLRGKSWKATYISGAGTTLDKGAPVTLTVNRDWVTIRASKTKSFSVPAANLRAVDSRTQLHERTQGWENFWGDFFSTAGNDSNGALAVIAAIPIIFIGEGILASTKTTDHFVSLYWLEDGVMKSAEFRVGGDNAESLLAALNNDITGAKVENLEEIARTRQKAITDEFASSPVVEIDRQVSIGWNSVAPGQYRLIVIPRERGLAEVYFFPANKPAPEFLSAAQPNDNQSTANLGDFPTQAVAEFERREKASESKTARSVSYREQNGIVTFSQIETDEFILRFTPIPLGFAK